MDPQIHPHEIREMFGRWHGFSAAAREDARHPPGQFQDRNLRHVLERGRTVSVLIGQRRLQLHALSRPELFVGVRSACAIA
jgi:hypothetical protein